MGVQPCLGGGSAQAMGWAQARCEAERVVLLACRGAAEAGGGWWQRLGGGEGAAAGGGGAQARREVRELGEAAAGGDGYAMLALGHQLIDGRYVAQNHQQVGLQWCSGLAPRACCPMEKPPAWDDAPPCGCASRVPVGAWCALFLGAARTVM